jgi:hypothetical protein
VSILLIASAAHPCCSPQGAITVAPVEDGLRRRGRGFRASRAKVGHAALGKYCKVISVSSLIGNDEGSAPDFLL